VMPAEVWYDQDGSISHQLASSTPNTRQAKLRGRCQQALNALQPCNMCNADPGILASHRSTQHNMNLAGRRGRGAGGALGVSSTGITQVTDTGRSTTQAAPAPYHNPPATYEATPCVALCSSRRVATTNHLLENPKSPADTCSMWCLGSCHGYMLPVSIQPRHHESGSAAARACTRLHLCCMCGQGGAWSCQ
jgi:hypothetical protein